jgi:hypothetical protein
MTDWTTFLYALLPHPDERLVLAIRGMKGFTLPTVTQDERIWSPNTQVMQPLFAELIGVPINILNWVASHRDDEAHQVHRIHLLEPRDGTLPLNAVWQPLEEILEYHFMPSNLQAGLERWNVEFRSRIIPDLRAPWSIPGWHAEVERWIADQVARLGRGPIRKIEPVKSWSISCVLRVVTETGILYFKVPRDLPLFVNEGVVLSRLAELYPNRLPVPLAIESERGWMLLDDFGGQTGHDADLDQQARLMQDFARLQIDSSQKIEALLDAGCKDRRMDIVLSQIEPLFEDELVLAPLTLEERDQLKMIAPRLRALIAELFSLPIPVALLHGDLHAGNAIMRENSLLYFDWTDAAVSHPFFDMIHIFMEEHQAKKTALQEAYLLPWEENYSKIDVMRAWELGDALYGLYHAVSYQYIAHGIEELVRPELNFAFHFLRKLLEGIKRLDGK